MPAPQPDDEFARLALLHRLQVLDTANDPVLDGLVRCAAAISGCPIALVSLIDRDRQWFKARHGLETPETARADAFCAHAILQDGMLEVPDARRDARFSDNPLVLGAPHVVFYAGQPVALDRHRLGTLCVIDHVPRELDAGQRELLSGLARAVEHWLESRREQIALRESEALLRRLGAELPGSLFQFRRHADGRYCMPYASERLREIYALALDDLREDATALFRHLHPQDRKAVLGSIVASAHDLAPWQQEFRAWRPRRGWRWCEGVAHPERLPDGGTLWHGFITDITERKALDLAYRQAQQRCQLAIEAAQLGLVEIDPDRGGVLLDARAMRQHDLSIAGGELALDTWLGRFEVGDRDRLRAAVASPGRDGATLTLTAALAPDAAGTARHLEIALQRQGRTSRWAGSCRDVSESLQLEQLRREKLAAEQASREKSVFLSRVSHELRTPLNAILGFTQLLQLDPQRPLDPVQHSRIELVRHAGLHLLDLINDVLDLTRFEQGSRPMNLDSLGLDATLEACTSMVEPLAQKMSVELVRPDPGDRLRVIADSRALEQVLFNLLSNGVKYNRPGGRLTVGVRTRGAQVEISVSDEGAGLSDKQLAQLFQPFNRLGAENAGVEGSGLGLVIAKNLVEAMGGELSVRSTPGRGSTFSLVLARADVGGPGPARLGGLTVPGALSGFGELLPGSAADAPAATIVYIEDEPVNALLVTEALQAIPQWQVVVATDGEQGLQLARRLRPDVLLVDINIPRLTGDQVVRALRRDADTEHLHCIALSADALPEQIAAARAAGFDDYWTKPLDLLTLVPRLMGLLADEPLAV